MGHLGGQASSFWKTLPNAECYSGEVLKQQMLDSTSASSYLGNAKTAIACSFFPQYSQFDRLHLSPTLKFLL